MVTRIIAGAAGGTRIDVPASGTRPTSDRVRESLFGALVSAGVLDGARVADLYAGSGALGLEALSRAAAAVDLVEQSAGAAAVIRRNAQRVGTAMRRDAAARVHRMSVAAFLARATGPYDLVFLDPPYDVGNDELTAALALLTPVLSPDAIVVVERSTRSPDPVLPPGLVMMRSRRYGDTTLWWLQPRAASQS